LPHSSQINCESGDEGKEARSWYVDETSVNVKGKWCSLYRAIDRDGNVVDSMLSEKRDMEAARRFFKQAGEVVGPTPERVTTDGHASYPRAIRETPGSDIIHRCNPYLNHRLEQDHRGIKQRSSPMRGFGSVASASRFCRAFDEVLQFFRVRTTMKQKVSLVQQRDLLRQRLDALPGHGCDGLTHENAGGGVASKSCWLLRSQF
jgi:transposase-like protein